MVGGSHGRPPRDFASPPWRINIARRNHREHDCRIRDPAGRDMSADSENDDETARQQRQKAAMNVVAAPDGAPARDAGAAGLA